MGSAGAAVRPSRQHAWTSTPHPRSQPYHRSQRQISQLKHLRARTAETRLYRPPHEPSPTSLLVRSVLDQGQPPGQSRHHHHPPRRRPTPGGHPSISLPLLIHHEAQMLQTEPGPRHSQDNFQQCLVHLRPCCLTKAMPPETSPSVKKNHLPPAHTPYPEAQSLAREAFARPRPFSHITLGLPPPENRAQTVAWTHAHRITLSRRTAK
jgi:hypothetical protein